MKELLIAVLIFLAFVSIVFGPQWRDSRRAAAAAPSQLYLVDGGKLEITSDGQLSLRLNVRSAAVDSGSTSAAQKVSAAEPMMLGLP